jgi:opacity protein-like surface antigen
MKNKTAVLAAALAAAVVGGVQQARAGGWNGDANILVAGKHLDSGDWGVTDRMGELGVITNWTGPQWPVSLAADFLAAGDSESISRDGFTEQRGHTRELMLGARKIFRPDAHIRPYFGGGFDFASAELERIGPFERISDEDSGLGLWVDGGVFWTINEVLNLGVDLRFSGANVHLLGSDRNAGGASLGVTAGYHWGA